MCDSNLYMAWPSEEQRMISIDFSRENAGSAIVKTSWPECLAVNPCISRVCLSMCTSLSKHMDVYGVAVKIIGHFISAIVKVTCIIRLFTYLRLRCNCSHAFWQLKLSNSYLEKENTVLYILQVCNIFEVLRSRPKAGHEVKYGGFLARYSENSQRLWPVLSTLL